MVNSEAAKDCMQLLSLIARDNRIGRYTSRRHHTGTCKEGNKRMDQGVVYRFLDKKIREN